MKVSLFCCRKCHKIGHIAARCAAVKTKSRRPPSWRSGASSEHYTVVKSSDAPQDLAVVSADISSADDLSVPVLKEDPVPSPAPVLDVPPGLVGGQDPLPSPAPAPILPPGSMGGQLAMGSSKKIVGFSDSPGLHCSVSSGDWIAEAAKVEDGWTMVKRKNTRPLAPPLEMNLRSCKGGSKSKGKL